MNSERTETSLGKQDVFFSGEKAWLIINIYLLTFSHDKLAQHTGSKLRIASV